MRKKGGGFEVVKETWLKRGLIKRSFSERANLVVRVEGRRQAIEQPLLVLINNTTTTTIAIRHRWLRSAPLFLCCFAFLFSRFPENRTDNPTLWNWVSWDFIGRERPRAVAKYEILFLERFVSALIYIGFAQIFSFP